MLPGAREEYGSLMGRLNHETCQQIIICYVLIVKTGFGHFFLQPFLQYVSRMQVALLYIPVLTLSLHVQPYKALHQ